jgi:hypothetical protein
MRRGNHDVVRHGRLGARRGETPPPHFPAPPKEPQSLLLLHRSSPPTTGHCRSFPIAGIASRGGRRRWPPVFPPNRPLLAPKQPTNRTLANPRSLPCPPRPDSGDASPEFRRTSAGRAPRDPIARRHIFLRGNPQTRDSSVRKHKLAGAEMEVVS